MNLGHVVIATENESFIFAYFVLTARFELNLLKSGVDLVSTHLQPIVLIGAFSPYSNL